MNSRAKLDRERIMDVWNSERVKVLIDWTDLLLKFPELFSVTVTQPEFKIPFDLDPNEAVLPPPVFHHKKYDHSHLHARAKIVIPKSPFTGSGLVKDPEERAWHYIDETDVMQGPFTSIEMDNWFDQGFFFNELLVKYNDDKDIHRLIDLFGKVEYPSSKNISRRTSTNYEEELPSLSFGKSFSSIESMPQKCRFHKAPHRMSAEIHPEMLNSNLWQSFVDKKFDSHPPSNQSETKFVENKMPAAHETTKPTPVESTKPQEKVADKAHVQTKKEEKEHISKNPQDLHAEEEAPASKGKSRHRKHHKRNEKKNSEEIQHLNMEQVVESKKETTTETKSKKKKKNKDKNEHPVESQTKDAVVAGEEIISKKSKKSQKNKHDDHRGKFVEHITYVPKQTSQAAVHDRRDRGKYITVFEPKVEQPNTELKDKAQETNPKTPENDQSKHEPAVKHKVQLKNNGNYFEPKNAQFVEGIAATK